ncbi:uncharacterized protein LOC124805851 [Hydra vulgaris]|uniref:uncharacterized protein LOC124805851 n=1 Tax=Hydra vulgaris TaxID=6087 RepID=UPI001F5E6CA3|nr:uncharacterized protein LOC124805851 [Hydra vulgaris]
MSCAVFEDADSSFGEGIPIPHKNLSNHQRRQPIKGYQSNVLQIKSGSSFQNEKRNKKQISSVAQCDNFLERCSKETSRTIERKGSISCATKDLDLSKCEIELLRRKKKENKHNEVESDNENFYLKSNCFVNKKVRKVTQKYGDEFGKLEKDIGIKSINNKETSKSLEICSSIDNHNTKKFRDKKQEAIHPKPILPMPFLNISEDNLSNNLNQLPNGNKNQLSSVNKKERNSKISKKELTTEHGVTGNELSKNNKEIKYKTINLKTEQSSYVISQNKFNKNSPETDSLVSQVTPVNQDNPFPNPLENKAKIKKDSQNKIQFREKKVTEIASEPNISSNKNNGESQSEILRLQQKMSKLQNKIASMQKKVIRLQGSLKQQ